MSLLRLAWSQDVPAVSQSATADTNSPNADQRRHSNRQEDLVKDPNSTLAPPVPGYPGMA
jgi:hypothetical protein